MVRRRSTGKTRKSAESRASSGAAGWTVSNLAAKKPDCETRSAGPTFFFFFFSAVLDQRIIVEGARCRALPAATGDIRVGIVSEPWDRKASLSKGVGGLC